MKAAAEIKPFLRNYSLTLRGRLHDLSTPAVMGIINVTSDSFYAGSRVLDEGAIAVRAGEMLEHGATFLDVGAYSTRPGAEEVSVKDELENAVKAVRAILKAHPTALISIDTFRNSVAAACIDEGAVMINDVSGGDRDPEMFSLVAARQVPYVLMHMRGTPQTMMQLNQYDNLHVDIIADLQRKLAQLRSLGVRDVIVDPGFGFAKSGPQNYELLAGLELFNVLDCPILVGLSRKSMVWKTLEITPEDALNGTTVVNTIALMKGTSILRVHDVAQAAEAVKLVSAFKLAASHLEMRHG